MMKISLFVLLLIITSSLFAQSAYTQQDVDICNSKFDLAVSKDLQAKPINEIIIELGKSFLGTDYKAHTIEPEGKEKLVINLSGLDCYTYIESVLVLARLIKKGSPDFESYLSEVIKLRYRKGRLKEYPSRLHYFSDWIYDAKKRKIVKDVTREIGGEKYENDVSFMSNNANLYKQLKGNPQFIEEMKMIETVISKRDYYYIPQNKIANLEYGIQSGDIIGLTTGIKGLDISHTGIAIKMDDGKIYLMHAPQKGQKVQITKEPLADYVKKAKRHTGIMVARPI